MKTEELIRYYKANIEAIEKGLNNDSRFHPVDCITHIAELSKP